MVQRQLRNSLVDKLTIVVIMDNPKSKYGERFVKVKVIIKTWTEVESIIEYDTYYEQFIIPNGFQHDCKIIKWDYI